MLTLERTRELGSDIHLSLRSTNELAKYVNEDCRNKMLRAPSLYLVQLRQKLQDVENIKEVFLKLSQFQASKI